MVNRVRSVDHQTIGARYKSGQIDGSGAGFAIHHITATAIDGTRGRDPRRTDDHIGQAIAVDIARRADRHARVIGSHLTVDGKPTGSAATCGHCGQVHRLGAGLAKHHIAVAWRGACAQERVPGADDHVAQAVAVHIACAADRVATLVAAALAVDHKATQACGNICQPNRVGQQSHRQGLAAAVAKRIRGQHIQVIHVVGTDVSRRPITGQGVEFQNTARGIDGEEACIGATQAVGDGMAIGGRCGIEHRRIGHTHTSVHHRGRGGAAKHRRFGVDVIVTAVSRCAGVARSIGVTGREMHQITGRFKVGFWGECGGP